MNALIGLLQNLLALVSLESGFEAKQLSHRLTAFVLILGCAFAAVLFLCIAGFYGLVSLGIPVYAVALGFAFLFIVTGICVYFALGKRSVEVGKPFEGTRQEINSILMWLQSILK